MTDRAQSLSFERVAHEYDATRGGEERGEAVAAALLPQLAGRHPVLEVGVGTGLVAAPLLRAGVDVVGVDLSPAMLARARDRIGHRLAVGDAQRLPVADGTLDAAYVVWVLHLVADVSAVLAEVARVLRPGGLLLVVPGQGLGPYDADVDVVVREMWHRLQPEGRPDDPDRVTRLAAAAGLRPVARETFVAGARELAPEELARRIEGRMFSVLWEIDEATWSAEVEPLLARVRALPDQARPRSIAETYALLTFTR